MINNNKVQVDLPVFEWLRFIPAATTSLTSLTRINDGVGRYMYFFYGAQLFRYDTYGDTWQTLSIGATPVTALAVQYDKYQGFQGKVLSVPTSTSIRIPSTNVNNLVGTKIQIISGTGVGQERTITSMTQEVTHDMGMATSATTSMIGDTIKRWKQNQWVGYTLKINFGSGLSQYREILYNDSNTATIFDANYEGRDFLSTPYNASAPYGTPGVSSSDFVITSQVIGIDSAWTVTPDTTSRFKILSGGIWWVSANTVAPFFNFYYYDVLTDRWVTKLTPTGLIPAALSTDWNIEPISDQLSGILASGTATSATAKTLINTSLSLTPGVYDNYSIMITGGLGVGQRRRIKGSNSNTFSIASQWDTIPNNTSTYKIVSREQLLLVGNARAQMLKYLPEFNTWSYGNVSDGGITNNLCIKRASGRLQHGVSSATRTTGGITVVNTIPTVGGINYSYGDLLTISTGGTLGRVFVENIDPITGAVLTVSLYTAGNTYTVGTGRATTGGTGSGCTIEITAIGTIGIITTALTFDMYLGESITFLGATETAWNTTYTVLGYQSTTVFEVITTAIATAVPFYTLGVNLLQDLTKNWVSNEFSGKILGVQSNALTGILTFRKIIGNSSNTISFISGVAPTNGNSRYFIQDVEAFGKDSSYLADNQLHDGYATSGTVTTLVDSSKAWFPAIFNNNKVKMLEVTSGNVVEEIINSNTATTLNIGRSIALGSGTNTLAYSNDNGLTWIANGVTMFSIDGRCATWSGTRFVAGGTGVSNTLAYSNDGINWVGLGLIFSTKCSGICWNGTRFVAVGTGASTVYYSNDGITWVAASGTVFGTTGNAVAWNGTYFVAVGAGTNSIIYSADGITWTGLGLIFTTAGYGIAWNGTRFVAVGDDTTNTIQYSTTGISGWTGAGKTVFTTIGYGVAWNGTRFAGVGTGTYTFGYSTDGTSWTQNGTIGLTTGGYAISWNGARFIAGGTGTNTTAYSTDGLTWVGNGSSIFTTAGYGVCSTSPFVSLTPNIGLIPTSSTQYDIQDSFGMTSGTQSTTQLQDLNKKWKVNQWIGKKLLFTSGTGVNQELAITANAVNTLTFAAATAPDLTTTYTIIGKPATGAGINIFNNFNTTDTANKCRFLVVPRGGGSHTFDKYNISTNRWEYGNYIVGYGELLTSGSMYAYDGDRIYYQSNITGKIFYYDIVKKEIHTVGTVPYGMSTAILSNRMEIITTVDGLKYLYIMRHTAQEFWRLLINF